MKNKSSKKSREISCSIKKVAGIFFLFIMLMMIITIFSQMAMEIYAYNFALGLNMEKKNLILLKSSVDNEDKITGECTEETTACEEQTEDTSPVISFIVPVNGGVTTSQYGDTQSRSSAHLGHDWAVPVGTEVTASAEGIVEKAYFSESYGYNILISHGENIKTRYAHLSQINVSVGENVVQGQVIGLSGSTGDSTGPHLHFEVIVDGEKKNPLDYLH